ncbi:unnamed protein product, partial [Mesorhabditis belari]|uniref:PRKCA-binding protein n=1 Tax=Mesorhabditis belari TaxID=2138241 RepID=A0AAF3FMI6_9BILA
MEEDRMGMRINSEVVEITKDPKGLVGVSIGGGHPYCPCVYVVQLFDGSPAADDGRIRAGDEVVAVNGTNVKGDKKTHVAQLIQTSANPVKLTINKLDIDTTKGKTVDIVMKKIKHKMVSFMENDTADALGLSRAILCNDPLLKKMQLLEENAEFYRTLIAYFTELCDAQEGINKFQKMFGDAFCELAAHESQANASLAFTVFGEAHRSLGKRQGEMVKSVRPLINDLVTYVEKAIPDTELTLKKLKEMDDEEVEFHSLQESLYRVETGNYEYRLMLRCRQETRERFVRMRNDVMVKIELLDQKHVRDIAQQLTNLVSVLRDCQTDCASALLQAAAPAPVEIDIIQRSQKFDHRASTSSANENEGADENGAAEVSEPQVDLLDVNEPEIDLISSDSPTNGINLVETNLISLNEENAQQSSGNALENLLQL